MLRKTARSRKIPDENDSHLARRFYNTHSRTHVPRGTSRSRKKSRKPLISLKFSARGRQCESEVELRWCRSRHCTKPSGVCQVFFSHSVKLVLEGQVSAHSKALTCINPATIIKVIALITRRRSAKSKNDAKWWVAPIIANLHGVCQVFFNFCTI